MKNLFKSDKGVIALIVCLLLLIAIPFVIIESCIESCNAHDHVWEEIGREDATCSKDGYVKYKCTECDEEKTETLTAQHVLEEVVVQYATCTEVGYKEIRCSKCDYCKTEKLYALGHDYIEKTVKSATCDEDGEMEITCSRCDYCKAEKLHALGHDCEERIVENATCTANGTKAVSCKNCDYYATEIIPATGHKFVETIVNDATCTDSGTKKYTCSVCGYYEMQAIAPKGHTYLLGDCVRCGKKEFDMNVSLSHSLPHEVSYKWSTISTYSTCSITNVVIESKKKYLWSKCGLHVTISGVKTYDNDGEYGENRVSFRVVLRDANGNIIANETASISDILLSQEFTEELTVLNNIEDLDLSQHYTIEITDRVI